MSEEIKDLVEALQFYAWYRSWFSRDMHEKMKAPWSRIKMLDVEFIEATSTHLAGKTARDALVKHRDFIKEKMGVSICARCGQSGEGIETHCKSCLGAIAAIERREEASQRLPNMYFKCAKCDLLFYYYNTVTRQYRTNCMRCSSEDIETLSEIKKRMDNEL